MDVSVEQPGGLKRRLKVQIPAERVNSAVDEKIQKVGSHARIPGFRPGKTPKKVLYQRFGARARQEAVGELIQSVFPDAVQESELTPAGQPEIEIEAYEENGPLAFTASFEVFPEIELAGLDTIEVVKPLAEVGEADVDRTIERLREQHKIWEEVERESADGDQVITDFVGRIDGEAFEGGTGNDVEVILGKNQFLPDMERGLVGRRAGEEFQVEVAFPDDYGAEHLSGKTATFDVTVKAVKQAHLPELDAAFVEQMGIEEGTIEAFRGRVRESLEQEIGNAIENRVKSQTLEGLYAANPIDVPAALVAQEIERMRKEARQRLPEGMRENEEQARLLFPDEALRQSAEKRVALGLLFREVMAVHELELDQARVAEKLDAMASAYGEQAEAVKNYYRENPQLMEGLQAMVMEEQVVESLLDSAVVSDREMTVDELLDSNDQQAQESAP